MYIESLYFFGKQHKSCFKCYSFLGISFNFFTFVTGNLTDTYSVTFQLISIYYILHYYWSDSIEHPPFYMFVHGFCACIVGLMRPTNTGMWIPFGIILTYHLLKNKQVTNFFINLAALLSGVFVAFIPVIAYGIKHNLLEEIWHGTFTANLAYTSNNIKTKDIGVFLKSFIFQPAFLIVILCFLSALIVILCIRENVIFKITYSSMLIASLFIMNVSMRPVGQYNHLYVVFTIPIILFFFKKAGNLFSWKLWGALIIICTLLANLQLIKQMTKYDVFDSYYTAALEMKEQMTLNADSKVIVTGCHSVFYNVTDTIPHIKYFITYGGGLGYSVFPDATEMQQDSICAGENDYIIAVYDNNGTLYGVEEIDDKLENYFHENCEIAYEQTKDVRIVLYKDVSRLTN